MAFRLGFGFVPNPLTSMKWWGAPANLLDGYAPRMFLDFNSGKYEVQSAVSTLANSITVSNNSAIRTYIDQSGALVMAAANTPRIDWAFGYPRLLLEGAATNFAENAGNTGAVVGVIGAGGALPSYVSMGTGIAGLTFEVTAKGSTGGVPWTEIRISGTNNTGGNAYPDMSPSNRPAAAVGETWSYSLYAALVAGAWPASSGAGKVVVAEYSASSSYIVGSDNNVRVSTWKRYSHSRTLTSATVVKARGLIGLQINAGETVDFTFRIGGLQLEKSPSATSLIQTNGTVLTRTADLATLHASAGDMTAWAWRGYVPSLIASQNLLGATGGDYLRSGGGVPADLYVTGRADLSALLVKSVVMPGNIQACFGFGASGRRGSNAGSVAVADTMVPDRSRTTMFIGPSTGLVPGQVIYLDELVGWVLPDLPSSAGVQAQARAAA